MGIWNFNIWNILSICVCLIGAFLFLCVCVISSLPQKMDEEEFPTVSYDERSPRTRIGCVSVICYELLDAKIKEYQWKVDHGAPAISPEQIQMYEAEIMRLTPLLNRLRGFL